jgi:DNA-binding response OmpR family regulator
MTFVLVIEDDASVGAAIQMMLDHEGYATVHAPDADAGMRIFEASSFDLVVVDIFMPGANGLETIAELRNRAAAVPILAMSGFRFRNSTDQGLDFLDLAKAVGATACLRKPFIREQLIAAVRTSLESAISSVQA